MRPRQRYVSELPARPVVRPRLPQLDVVRAVAVLLVLGRHSVPPSEDVAEPLRSVGELWAGVGWIGVDLFFVLSGFLVSGLLFTELARHHDVRIGRFLVRRGFKIYPSFYLFLLVTWAISVYVRHEVVDPHLIRNEALYLQNYLGPFWNHTWSLAVEEHFYFGLALLVAATLRLRATAEHPLRPLAILLPAACVGVLVLRLLLVVAPYDFNAYLFPTHLRIDSLFWGVLLSYLYHFHGRTWVTELRRHRLAVLFLAALLLLPPFRWSVQDSVPLGTWGLTSIALAFTLVLALTLPSDDALPERRRGTPLLAAIGAASYSIYLWHMPIRRWVVPWYQTTWLFAGMGPTAGYALNLAMYLLTSIGVGFALTQVIERPALALRDRLFPSRVGAFDGADAADPGAHTAG